MFNKSKISFLALIAMFSVTSHADEVGIIFNGETADQLNAVVCQKNDNQTICAKIYNLRSGQIEAIDIDDMFKGSDEPIYLDSLEFEVESDGGGQGSKVLDFHVDSHCQVSATGIAVGGAGQPAVLVVTQEIDPTNEVMHYRCHVSYPVILSTVPTK